MNEFHFYNETIVILTPGSIGNDGDYIDFYSIISSIVCKGLENEYESYRIVDDVIAALEPIHRYNDVVGNLYVAYEQALRVYTFQRNMNGRQIQLLGDFFARGFFDVMVRDLDMIGDDGNLDPVTDGLVNFREDEVDRQHTWSFPYFYAAVA